MCACLKIYARRHFVCCTYIHIYSHIRRLVRSRMWKAAQETKWKFYFLPVAQPTPAAPSYGWPNKCWQPNLLAVVLAAGSLHCSLFSVHLVYRCAPRTLLPETRVNCVRFYIRVHVYVFIVLVTLFVYTVVWAPNRNFRHVKQTKGGNVVLIGINSIHDSFGNKSELKFKYI